MGSDAEIKSEKKMKLQLEKESQDQNSETIGIIQRFGELGQFRTKNKGS